MVELIVGIIAGSVLTFILMNFVKMNGSDDTPTTGGISGGAGTSPAGEVPKDFKK